MKWQLVMIILGFIPGKRPSDAEPMYKNDTLGYWGVVEVQGFRTETQPAARQGQTYGHAILVTLGENFSFVQEVPDKEGRPLRAYFQKEAR